MNLHRSILVQVFQLVILFLIFFSNQVVSQDSTYISGEIDSLQISDDLKESISKSGYEDLSVTGGATSVNAELVSDDQYKNALFEFDYSSKIFKEYYNFKKNLNNKYNIAVGLDYMFLNQFASFSYSDKQAASGIFRFFGSWTAIKDKDNNAEGLLVFKIENRHKIGPGIVPRNLGYEAGSALSTASFKEFGWGLTNLYWKHYFSDKKYRIIAGIMDAGDWVDLFPLLNSYKYYMNEGFFNSPVYPLPNQGLGFVGMIEFSKNIYMAAGIHDANGEPTNYLFKNIKSFFGTNEYFTWIEGGYTPTGSIMAGETIHLTYWHQDARVSKGLEESWGLSFSASTNFAYKYNPFIRIGISEGNAPVMHYLIATGIGINTRGFDYLGAALSWGAPSDRSKRAQYGVEVFYALQLSEHINLTPDVQFTINPSFNDEKKYVGVYSVIRLRYAM